MPESHSGEDRELATEGGQVFPRRRGLSRRVARVTLVIALMAPVLLAAAGALLGWVVGWPLGVGALVGLIICALVIGTSWIGLGIFAARSELRLRSPACDGKN